MSGTTSSYVARANALEPSELHAELRAERCPVHHVVDHDPEFDVVSHHTDVMAVLRAPSMWRNGDGPGVFVQRGGVLGSADDPDHRRQRTVLNDDFRPARVARLRPSIDRFCDALWEPFTRPGEGDVVELFAFPLPALVIAELLGVHAEDRDRFKGWSAAVVNALGGGDLDTYQRATDEIWAYLDALVDERIAVAGTGAPMPADVLGTMTTAHLAGVLSRTEVRRLGHQLLVAGHETTTSLIALMFFRLGQHPELLRQLHDHPELIEVAVEELLRFDSPVQGLFRTNAETCAVAGVELAAGSKLQVLFAAANRDPDVWDDPDTLRFDRDLRRLRTHLAFGWGVHHCIGASLARLEATIALSRIVEGFERLELVTPPITSSPFILRGFDALVMRWQPRRAGALAR